MKNVYNRNMDDDGDFMCVTYPENASRNDEEIFGVS